MSNEFTYGDITYSDLRLINSQTMAHSAIKTHAWLDVAATAQLIPINISEFKLACTDMPIIFSPIGKPMPIALTSFLSGKNVFVQNGQWQEGTYVPAALRRYPFVLGDATAEGKRPFYIDSTAISDEHEHALFNASGGSEKILENAIQHCKDYDDHLKLTENVIDLLDSLNLFKETQLIITDKKGIETKTGIFKIIDNDKYKNLNNKDIITLQKNHALWIIHTHIVSMSRTRKIASNIL
jgi:hypothetical protein